MLKGRDANRQPLMWDPSMDQDPSVRFHIRDAWFGDEPWSGQKYDRFEGRIYV